MAPLIDPDTARDLVLRHALPRAPLSLAIDQTIGLQLTEDIRADADYPPFPRAMMDGYAVRLLDAGRVVKVIGESAAGHPCDFVVGAGEAVAIMTGAPCPRGTEAVVPKERVEDAEEGVRLPLDIKPMANLMPKASECARGDVILRAGDWITPLALAALHTFGIRHVRATPRPTAAVITTGDELVPSHMSPGPAQIRNSNGPMLSGALRLLGVEDVLVLHANDDSHAFSAALDQARPRDLIVLSGAVSAGKYDTVPQALQTYGATRVFHKVSQQPGKPLLFAVNESQLIFGLPGNPLSCHLGIHRYIAPAVRKILGMPHEPDATEGILTAPVAAKDTRTLFQLVCAHADDAGYRVNPTRGKSSADLYSGALANAMIRIEPGQGEIAAGTKIRFEWLLGSVRR
ncbi:MAG: molybdopterin molybdenumtransferase MoeA [Candidatus Hydrogenedentota bacterium]